MPINHAYDLAPKILIQHITHLYKINKNWLEIKEGEGRHFTITKNTTSKWIDKLGDTASDLISLYALSAWVGQGPKIYRPSLENCKAMMEVDIKIDPTNYRQPYQAMLIDLPQDFQPPHVAVLCFLYSVPSKESNYGFLFASTFSKDNNNDIINCIKLKQETNMEEVIARYNEDVGPEHYAATNCFRVALNFNLFLTNYAFKAKPLFPAEFTNNRDLMNKGGEVEKKARERAIFDLRLLTLDQEVRVFKEEKIRLESQGGTHASPAPHWRRGHWRKQPCGPNSESRKLTFIHPVFVRQVQFLGHPEDTKTIYKGG